MEQLRKPSDLTMYDDDNNKEESVRGVTNTNYENLREKKGKRTRVIEKAAIESSVLVRC